jgi:D-beta-D-heptose 7-phosphate kinase/D-beta-D-heptose 1-phosphate adenosyltransferase
VSRLLVLGDTLLDRDVEGGVDRVCPDAPAPVVDVRSVRDRPGGAGLAALLAAGCGGSVTLATALGRDAAGDRVRALLAGTVDVHQVLTPAATVGKTRVRSGGHTLVRVDDAGHLLGAAAARAVPAEGDDVDRDALGALVLAHDAVLVADYGGLVARHPVVRAVLEQHAATVPVVWDPHPRGVGPVRGARVVTPNAKEAQGFSSAGPGLDAVAADLRRAWGVQAVCVTDGDRGVVLDEGGADAHRWAGPVCAGPVDTCGAGDRFAVAVAQALAAGEDVRRGVQGAVQVVSAWLAAGGVATVGPVAEPGGPRGASRPAAEHVVDAVRARGGTVVATGGCFDVLHAGHLALLERARALGGCLVVLLNSDASTRRLKGDGRPVNPVADRARLLEALRCVDAVVVFEDDDPRATLERLRPDVWVKGGDYRVDDLPETALVRSYGGRVQVLPFVPGRSTTSVLARLVGTGGT